MTDFLDQALEDRLKLAEDPSYEGGKMTKSDVVQLVIATFIFPMILMMVGWLIK